MTILYHAALLAGLGPHAHAASEPDTTQAGAGAARTCVDGGGRLMLALDAPGARALHTLRRTDDGAAPGVCRWHAERRTPHGPTERRAIATFPGDDAAAWACALDAAAALDGIARLRSAHAALGPQARVFGVERDLAAPEAWVIWQLDRRADVSRALAAVGAPEAWAPLAELLAGLTGRAVTRTGGPWSIARPLHADGPLRVGTTMWARVPEGHAKRRALAAAVESLGGDGRYAEALYRLLEQGAPGQRLGRAVEVTLDRQRIAAARWLLAAGARG